MYTVANGVKGIHILGVCENREMLNNLLAKNPMSPLSRYVLLEVGTEKETVRDILEKLGVPSNLAGSQYIYDAVNIALENSDAIERITKIMYPRLAKLHNTSTSRIERAIRVAIEKSWEDGDLEYKKKLFGEGVEFGQHRPTNSVYISSIVNYLK